MSKTIRQFTKKELLQDETFKKKGHAHEEREHIPTVCSACNGYGSIHGYTGMGREEDCPHCNGEGVIYD